MSNTNYLYFELQDMGIDENGDRCPAYAAIGPFEFKDGVTYDHLLATLEKKDYPKIPGISVARMRLISKEEYDANVDEDDDEEGDE